MVKKKMKRKRAKKFRFSLNNPPALNRKELLALVYTARNEIHQFTYYVEGMMDAGAVPPFTEADLHEIADCFIDIKDRIASCGPKLGI